jgi:hypothetical protein
VHDPSPDRIGRSVHGEGLAGRRGGGHGDGRGPRAKDVRDFSDAIGNGDVREGRERGKRRSAAKNARASPSELTCSRAATLPTPSDRV